MMENVSESIIQGKINLLLSEFSPLTLIATTPTGLKQLQNIIESTEDISSTLLVSESLKKITKETIKRTQEVQFYTGSLKDHIASLWSTQSAFVFCLATGAVIRLIAPLLKHKSIDPAVVVIDETGKYVISLCSGHQGGADKLAQLIALQMNATSILTGASTSLELPAVDMLGIPFGWGRGKGDWTAVSAAVAKNEPVQVIQDAGSKLWRTARGIEKSSFCFKGNSQGNSEDTDGVKGRICITYKSPLETHHGASLHDSHKLVYWYPRVLWVGIGCERGTSIDVISAAVEKIFTENQLVMDAIASITTIDIKSDEVGLLEFCKQRNLPLKTFPGDILKQVKVPNPSNVVAKEVGTPSVAEASALYASTLYSVPEGTQESINLDNNLLIPKQIFRLPEQPGAVTVAIALSEKEYIGKPGKISLVGTGPGQLQQMTPAAQIAVSSADVVIGYGLYVELISSILRTGQIIEALPITQERQRAHRAIELGTWGLNVAVISSGDCGIYGMAGLVLEELQNNNWDGKTPQVQIFPGISALQAAASRVGTPLMHDFCAISLSDLLTPWEVIQKRLQAAAVADFVTALYNPKSQTRIRQLTIAVNIFLQHRKPETPVAVIRSAYREDEQVTLTTLGKLLETPVDMLSLVLIGNQSTRTHGEWMITPRGYLGFE
ncbi:MAG: precorrin-3B C(17)-methyltransferase [Cyanobacteria bacterium P01_A01_bin.84]